MAYNPNNPNGQATMANSAPVVIASNQSSLPVSQKAATSSSVTLQSAATVTGNGTSLSVDGMSVAILTVSGTFVGTITFEGTEDGANFSSLNAIQLGTSTIASTATVPGLFELSVGGLVSIRARISAYTSGSITVTGHTDPISYTPKAVNVNVQGTVPVSAASLPLPTGAATSAKQPALGTAGSASTDVITVQGITSMTALKVDGSAVTQPVSGTVTANIGTSGSLALDATLTGGTQRTKITDGTNNAAVKAASTAAVASDPAVVVAVSPNNSVAVTGTFWQATQPVSGTVSASQSGTWTVQPGNTANTTPWLITQTPATSGGWSTYHLVSAATTNATNIKASAGQLGGWYIYNSNAAARKVAFHNSASAPTAGASVLFSIVIPPSSAANVEFNNGIPFSSGIGITTTTGLADSDATAVALNDLIINLFYK